MKHVTIRVVERPRTRWRIALIYLIYMLPRPLQNVALKHKAVYSLFVRTEVVNDESP